MVNQFPARKQSHCNVCQTNIIVGQMCAHRPGLGYVHAGCFTATPKNPGQAALEQLTGPDLDDTPDKWGGDDDDGGIPDITAPIAPPVPDVDAAVREGMGVAPKAKRKGKATANGDTDSIIDTVMGKCFEQLRQVTADQNRLVKAQVKSELKSSFTEEIPGLLAQITSSVKDATADLVAKKVAEARREFKAETERAIQKIAASGLVRQVVEIKKPDGKVTTLDGEVFHHRFTWICHLAQQGKPIFLVGPTGSGKTHIAMQLTRALHGDKWEDKFSALSCSPATAERHLLGRSIPKITTGEELYRSAGFIDRYEHGGVMCLDEFDASDPSVPVTLNAALSNKFCPVPDRTDRPIAKMHPDFVIIACANTWGRGADRRYVGRNPLDEATLDRFRIGTVPVNYSTAIERAVCPDDMLFSTLAGWRRSLMEHGLERVLSTRFFRDAYDMVTSGASMQDIKRAFFSGWSKDEVIKVLGQELPDDDE